MVLVGLYLALLVLIIVGFGMLVGRGAVMGLLLVLGKVPLAFLDQLLQLFQYPPRSSVALLAGTLPLRYCSAKFACRVPFWTLPVPGHVYGLVTADVQAAQVSEAEVARLDVHFVGDFVPGRKRIRLNRKIPAHLVGLDMHARPRVWKRLHCSGYTGVSSVDCKRRRCNQHAPGDSLVHSRTRVG